MLTYKFLDNSEYLIIKLAKEPIDSKKYTETNAIPQIFEEQVIATQGARRSKKD